MSKKLQLKKIFEQKASTSIATNKKIDYSATTTLFPDDLSVPTISLIQTTKNVGMQPYSPCKKLPNTNM